MAAQYSPWFLANCHGSFAKPAVNLSRAALQYSLAFPDNKCQGKNHWHQSGKLLTVSGQNLSIKLNMTGMSQITNLPMLRLNMLIGLDSLNQDFGHVRCVSAHCAKFGCVKF